MAKSEKRLQALAMRRKGMSMGSIALQLHVSKGSVSSWCREIVLSTAQKERLRQLQIAGGHRGRIIGAEKNRQQKLDAITLYEKKATKMIGNLSKRDLLLLGTGLYWGEGVKAHNSTTAMVNSDPAVILFAKKWFEECMGVSTENFRPYIFISEIHKNRERKILKFWSRLLKLPEEQFHKIIFLKGRPRKIYENHNSYYGVLTLRVRKGSHLKYRILGLIKACKEDAGVAQLVRAQHS